MTSLLILVWDEMALLMVLGAGFPAMQLLLLAALL